MSSVSRRLLERKLRELGVSPELIQGALLSLGEDSQLDVAKGLAEKRYLRLSNLKREVAERRLGSYLQRRGFSGPDVWQAVRHVMDNR